MGMFLNLVLLSVFLSLGTIEKIKRDYDYNNNHFDNNYNPNYYEYQQDHFRGDKDKSDHPLALPHGTRISFTPEISIPISSDGDDMSSAKVTTRFEALFPITVTFQKKMDMMMSTTPRPLLFQKTGFWDGFNSVIGDTGSKEIVSQQPRLLSRKLRDVSRVHQHHNTTSTRTRRCQSKSFIDRRAILQKMEVFTSNLLEAGSEHPKECLLRWACELHENSGVAGYYGLLGEAVMLVLSVQDLIRDCDGTDPHFKYLVPFVKAELAGKARKCNMFWKKCSQSIFACVIIEMDYEPMNHYNTTNLFI